MFSGGAFSEYAFAEIPSGNVTMTIDTAAAIAAAGQEVLFSISMAISAAGGVSAAGQTVLATLGMAISTSAMVTASGQEINLRPRFTSGPLFIKKSSGGKPGTYWRGRA